MSHALAASVGVETVLLKRRVRALKALGLTESLDVGYRLSPRGRDVLSALGCAPLRRRAFLGDLTRSRNG